MVNLEVEAMLHGECVWTESELRKLRILDAAVQIRRQHTPGKTERIEFVAELPGPPAKLFGSGFVSLVTIHTYGHTAVREATLELIEQVKEELMNQSGSGPAVR